jgi:hypothetical protein
LEVSAWRRVTILNHWALRKLESPVRKIKDFPHTHASPVSTLEPSLSRWDPASSNESHRPQEQNLNEDSYEPMETEETLT